MRAEPLPDHAAEREAAICETGLPCSVRDGQHIAPQLRDGVAAGRRIRSAMAAQVEPKHAKMPQQRRYLRVPHPVVRTQRVRQHQQRLIGRAFQPVVNPRSPRIGKWHGQSFPSSKRRRKISALPR